MNLAQVLSLAAVLAAGSAAAGTRLAHADLGDSAVSLAQGVAYVVPTGGSLFTGAVNGLYLGAGEGAPRSWRVWGVGFGAAAVLVGGYVLGQSGADEGRDYVIGGVPIVAGGGAILTAVFVGAPDDVVGRAGLGPLLVERAGRLELAGLSLVGRF